MHSWLEKVCLAGSNKSQIRRASLLAMVSWTTHFIRPQESYPQGFCTYKIIKVPDQTMSDRCIGHRKRPARGR